MGVFRRSLHVSIGLALAMGCASESGDTRGDTGAGGGAGSSATTGTTSSTASGTSTTASGTPTATSSTTSASTSAATTTSGSGGAPATGTGGSSSTTASGGKAGSAGSTSGAGGSGGAGPVDASGGRGGATGVDGGAGRGGSGGAGTGGSGGSGGGGVCDGVAAIVSKASFDQIFPLTQRNAFYTYDGFVQAASSYPAFARTGDCDQRKRDIAAFFANVSRETARLKYVEQIAKAPYCDSTFTKGPCEPGKQYYGRGPIQISWNYNYYSAGTCLGLGTQLLKNPDLVAQDPKIAWMTGLWFWNTGGSGSCTNEAASCALPPDTSTCDSPHKAITSDKGFGATIDIVNGVEECHGGTQSYAQQAVTERVCYFQKYVQILGTTVGPGDLNCGTTVGACPP